MPYSIDLRERVISAIDSGEKPGKVAERFKVNRGTVNNWVKLRKTTNDIKPKSGYQKGHSHKITDWVKFKDFAGRHKLFTCPRMVIEWEKETGVKVSESVMLRALHKIEYTSKKKLLIMPKKMKKSAQSF